MTKRFCEHCGAELRADNGPVLPNPFDPERLKLPQDFGKGLDPLLLEAARKAREACEADTSPSTICTRCGEAPAVIRELCEECNEYFEAELAKDD